MYKSRNSYVAEYIMFFIWPFYELTRAVSYYNKPWAKNVVWVFVVFFGYNFVLVEGIRDSSRYAEQFVIMYNQDISLSAFVNQFYSSTGYLDILEPVISFTISRFTGNPRILFASYGLVFGFFYSRNIWYIIENANSRISKKALIFIVTFSIIIGFWSINGFRMYSAAHIFFYGAIRYIFDNKYKGLLIAASSVLMHFSFLFPIIVLAVYPFVKQKNNLLFILFIISIFITELNLTEVRTFLTANLPYIFHDEIKSYTNVNYAEARFSKVLSWHALLYRKILNWTITAYLFYIYFKGRQTLNNNLKLLNLFSFSLLILTSANIVSNIPSGARFLSVANLFAMAMIYLFVEKTENKSLSSLRQITLPFLLFFCIVAIRDVGLDTIGLRTILSNPLTAIFFVDDIPLIDLIK